MTAKEGLVLTAAVMLAAVVIVEGRNGNLSSRAGVLLLTMALLATVAALLYMAAPCDAVTEAEARAALRAFAAMGGLAAWIADQCWEAIPGGWRVREPFNGWRFRLEPVAGGVRVIASANGGEPAVWVVPGREAGRGPAAILAALAGHMRPAESIMLALDRRAA
jgi:hypothetical protein